MARLIETPHKKEHRMRVRTMLGLPFVILLSTLAFAGEPDARQILDKVAEKYKAMQTYQSEVTAVVDVESDGGKLRLEKAVSMKLGKPNLYLITWKEKDKIIEQSGAVWNTSSQPSMYLAEHDETFFLKMGQDELALGMASANGVVHTIPFLFFPGRTPTLGATAQLTDARMEKIEKLNDENCYIIRGASSISKQETLWISTRTFLILQYSRSLEMPEGRLIAPEPTEQQLDETIRALGQKPSPESRTRLREETREMSRAAMWLRGSYSERFANIDTPELRPKDFRYEVPQGTAMHDCPSIPLPEGVSLLARDLLCIEMCEGITGAGNIRSAMRVYANRHGGVFPTWTGVRGDSLEPVLALTTKDLDGKYFKAASYEVTSTPKGYTIKATLGAETYIVNQDGMESGTFRTGQ